MINKTPTKRSLQAAETKSKIYKASIELFKKHGYHNVSIDDICTSVHVSKGAFYTHFPTKASVIIQLLTDIDEDLNTYYQGFSKDLPVIDQLLYIAMFVYDNTIGPEHIDMARIVYAEQAYGNISILFNHDRPLFQLLDSTMNQCKLLGQINPSIDTEALTRSLVELLVGNMFLSMSKKEDERPTCRNRCEESLRLLLQTYIAK